MNLRPAAAEHAYGALKADLLRGRFSPGTVLNVHTLAVEMGLSISPIRDAMGRLVGEHLVLLRAEGGFQMPPMTEDVATDLYQWNARLLLWAIRDGVARTKSGPQKALSLRLDHDADGSTIVDATARLFRTIASFSTSIELRRSVDAVSDRLEPLRHRETVLRDRATELRGIFESAVETDRRRLHTAIIRYHQRRIRRIPDIAALLYSHS